MLREADDETADQSALSVVMTGGETRPEAQHGATARSREPLVRISFSHEVRDMLGGDLVGVAEAMIDAATDYLGGETVEMEGAEPEEASPPVIH